MKSRLSRLAVLVIGLLVVFAAACATTVDKGSVQATAGAPVSAQVVDKIQYDAGLRRFVVVVEPLLVGAEGSPSAPVPVAHGVSPGWGPWGLGYWGSQPAPVPYSPPAQGISDRIGTGIAAQLVSGLSNAGLTVVDYQHYMANKGDPAKLCGPGEVGPFVVKGTVTEFNEVAEAGEKSKGASLGWAGTVLGIVGGIAGIPAAGYIGAGVSAANPTYQSTEMQRTGSVAMDIQIIDPATGRILGSAVASGKFTAKTATSGISVFGVGGGESAFAASALGQATRAAVADAVKQVAQRVSTGPR